MYLRSQKNLRQTLFGHFFNQLIKKYKNLQTFLIRDTPFSKKKVILCKFQTDTNYCFSCLYLQRIDLNPKSLLIFFTLTSNNMKTASATKAVERNGLSGSV